MRSLVIMVALAANLSAFSYAEPEVVVTFTRGSGQYQVGLAEDDVPVGPYRLIAADSLLYLLDQLNERIICLDESGSWVDEIPTGFRPADMALDHSGQIHLLENRTQPARVTVLDAGDEEGSLEIAYDVKFPIMSIAFLPGDRLLAVSGFGVYSLSYPRSALPLTMNEYDAADVVTLPVIWNRVYSLTLPWDWSGQTSRTLLAYDGERKFMGNETYIQDKSGSFSLLDLSVLEGDKDIGIALRFPSSYYSYDVGWRNVSIDGSGNIYMFVAPQEGSAKILVWRINP